MCVLNYFLEYPYEVHGGYGYGYGYGGSGGRYHQKPHSQLPPGFYGNPRLPVSQPDYSQPSDVPSVRNGAPHNGMRSPVGTGGIYRQGLYGVAGRGRHQGGIYGGFENGGNIHLNNFLNLC